MEQQVDLHLAWIENPFLKVARDLVEGRISDLVNKKWPGDIMRQREQIDVLKGILQERKK